jgi:hypothetical protein
MILKRLGTDVRAQPVKVDKTCQPAARHSSPDGMGNCEEAFAIEALQISGFATT